MKATQTDENLNKSLLGRIKNLCITATTASRCLFRFYGIMLQYFSEQCFNTPHDSIEGFHADDEKRFIPAIHTVAVAFSLVKALGHIITITVVARK